MRRYVAMSYKGLIFVSQEFCVPSYARAISPNAPQWESVVELFKGIRTIRGFELVLERAEDILHCTHIPVKIQDSLPKFGEVWRIDGGELELCAKNGRKLYDFT